MQSLKSIHHPEHGLPAVLVEQTPGLPTLPHMAPAPGSGKHYHSPMPVSIGRAQTLLPAHLCAILQGPILQPQVTQNNRGKDRLLTGGNQGHAPRGQTLGRAVMSRDRGAQADENKQRLWEQKQDTSQA